MTKLKLLPASNLMIATLAAILLMASSAFSQVMEQTVVPNDPLLGKLLQEAADANPSIQAMRARLEAAQAQVTQAGAWMDPKLSVGAMNLPADNPTDLNQEPMTGLWVNASQSIPLTGKYQTREEAAAAMANATGAKLGLQAATVEEAVRNTWYNWAFLRESVATVDTTIRLVDQLLSVTRSKYETGKGLQSDMLRLQTERSRLQSQKIELEQQARDAGRQLAILLGREPGDMPPMPADLPVEFPALAGSELLESVEGSPRIAIANEMLRAEESRVKLAKQMWWPELMIGGGYGYRQDADNGMGRADFISITAGITLPIFGANKQSMAVEEAVADKRAAQSSLREATLEVNRRLESLLDEDDRHAEQIQLYDEGVLPQARGALSSVMSDYSVARVDVEALVAAERELINARLQRLMHLRDRAKTRSAIASLIYRSTTDLNNSQTEEN